MPRPAVDLRKALPKVPARGRRAATTGSLGARITAHLREAIADGRFPLGGALSELRLAAAFSASRTPVREALAALQLEGLIEIRPQSGSFVFLPTQEEVGELAEFRCVLEATALRFAFARRRDATLRALRAALDAMQRARSADDRRGLARADTAFHRAIAENSANAYLIASYRMVSGRVAALRTHNLLARNTVRTRSLSEHRAIVTALAGGDVERACAVLAGHVLRMRSGYVRPGIARAPEVPSGPRARHASEGSRP